MHTETPTQENELALIIEKSGLEEQSSKTLQETFLPFYEQALEWNEKAKTIKVTDATQLTEMKQAGEARKALKAVRVNVEKRRKELKEDSLKTGKAIDSVANLLKALIEPTEEYLQEQEDFAKRAEEKRKRELKESREQLLQPFGITTEFYDLSNMPQEQFEVLYNNSKEAYEKRIAEAKQAEEERIAKEQRAILKRKREVEVAPYTQFIVDMEPDFEVMDEEDFQTLLTALKTSKAEYEKEQQRIREENERLRKEALAAEAEAKKQREEAEKKLAEEKAKAELAAKKAREESIAEQERMRKEAQAKLEAEKKERERVEAELRAKAEAEAKAKAEEEARVEAELSKGDKEKFQDFINDLETLKAKYTFKSKKFQTAHSAGVELINKTINYLISKQ